MRKTAILGLILSLLGCGTPDGPKYDLTPHPVRGKLIYDGKAASGVLVGLLPLDAPMPPAIPGNPRGVSGSDGTFTITTFKEGDGACEGEYQVLMTWMVQSDPNDLEMQRDKLLGWYDGAHSTIRVKVVKGENNIPTINMPLRNFPPEAMPGIPGRN